jgi:hypothetical protein
VTIFVLADVFVTRIVPDPSHINIREQYTRTIQHIPTIGGIIKVTPMMASRWVKAVFLVILGIVIMLYADDLVNDLRTALQDNFDVAFAGTWDLLTILLWVLVLWLFVDAALIIALSFSEHRFTLLDLAKRLDAVDKKLGIAQPKGPVQASDVDTSLEEVVEEEVPPPPKE